jgi:hypothetical protein
MSVDPNPWWSEPKLGSLVYVLKHSSSRIEIIIMLIARGWNANLHKINTFLIWADHHRYFEEVKILVDAGA